MHRILAGRRQIPGGCLDAGKWFAPSRGCVTRLRGCQTPIPVSFGPTQSTTIWPVFQETFPARSVGWPSHNAPAGAFIHPWPRFGVCTHSGLRCSNKQLKRTGYACSNRARNGQGRVQRPARHILAVRAFIHAGAARLDGRPTHRFTHPAIIPGRWPRWYTPLAHRPDFPARRAISAFSPLPRR
jgi:hypothetical protein